PVEQLGQPVPAPPRVLGLGRDLLVFDLDAEALRERFDRADEVDLLHLRDEGDRIAAFAAAEALEGATCRCDREAGRALLMEPAEALVRTAPLAPPDVVLGARQDLGGILDRFDRGVLDTRQQYPSANRSVIPAR